MKPITSMLTADIISSLASRSHLRYGEQIAEDGEIAIEKQNAFNVTAKVSHKNKKPNTTELMVTSKGLRWKCTCTGRKDLFCEHCVALALHMIKPAL